MSDVESGCAVPDMRPTDRVLAMIRRRRSQAPPAPYLEDAASLDEWRDAYNDLRAQVNDIERRVNSPTYALWVAALGVVTAALLKYAA